MHLLFIFYRYLNAKAMPKGPYGKKSPKTPKNQEPVAFYSNIFSKKDISTFILGTPLILHQREKMAKIAQITQLKRFSIQTTPFRCKPLHRKLPPITPIWTILIYIMRANDKS